MKEVHLLVFDGLADWEPALALCGLNDLAAFGRESYRTVTIGFTSEPVTTMAGLRVMPDRVLDDVQPDGLALFLIPGGEMWNAGERPEVTALLKCLDKAGTPIAGICAATTALAHAGLLEQRRHTSNSLTFLKERAPAYGGEASYVDAPAVADGGVVTAAGTAPLQFAREILRLLDAFDKAMLEEWYQMFLNPDVKD
ncbi:MAG TPA: type 1 glutamine amidotransferase family protein [Alphaproteobacteria bacterium]|nr:type 1 glutamine amidotransferase family protein [Alphaproteobacteria bacterium]